MCRAAAPAGAASRSRTARVGEPLCALRSRPPRSGRDTIQGRLELAAGAKSYAVEVGFFRSEPNGPVGLIVTGNSGDKIELWRRTFQFRAVFARAGDAQCAPDPKTS